ncbi:hypothetical protein L3Q82_003357 [Scortum barcoo]|uniref:Uncharacterized protein n=1 Tax=Scortum barcoo TaxID=214431 RepID=A0ACB8VMB9_9TELE|nr:hypothetical protein L3Q82_003357 [Scortum barcoo]
MAFTHKHKYRQRQFKLRIQSLQLIQTHFVKGSVIGDSGNSSQCVLQRLNSLISAGSYAGFSVMRRWPLCCGLLLFNENLFNLSQRNLLSRPSEISVLEASSLPPSERQRQVSATLGRIMGMDGALLRQAVVHEPKREGVGGDSVGPPASFLALFVGRRSSDGSYSCVGGSLAGTLKDTPPGPSLARVSSDLETRQGTINHKSTWNERGGAWWKKRGEETEGGKMGEEGRQRVGRGDPATPVIPGLVYGRQWPAGSQRSAALLQRLVDSAEWEITHQELTFRISEEGGMGEAFLRWEGRREEGKRRRLIKKEEETSREALWGKRGPNVEYRQERRKEGEEENQDVEVKAGPQIQASLPLCIHLNMGGDIEVDVEGLNIGWTLSASHWPVYRCWTINWKVSGHASVSFRISRAVMSRVLPRLNPETPVCSIEPGEDGVFLSTVISLLDVELEKQKKCGSHRQLSGLCSPLGLAGRPRTSPVSWRSSDTWLTWEDTSHFIHKGIAAAIINSDCLVFLFSLLWLRRYQIHQTTTERLRKRTKREEEEEDERSSQQRQRRVSRGLSAGKMSQSVREFVSQRAEQRVWQGRAVITAPPSPLSRVIKAENRETGVEAGVRGAEEKFSISSETSGWNRKDTLRWLLMCTSATNIITPLYCTHMKRSVPSKADGCPGRTQIVIFIRPKQDYLWSITSLNCKQSFTFTQHIIHAM